MGVKKEATAYILDESMFDAIAQQSGIERKVLENWRAHDQEWGIQTKVIVVMITEEGESK